MGDVPEEIVTDVEKSVVDSAVSLELNEQWRHPTDEIEEVVPTASAKDQEDTQDQEVAEEIVGRAAVPVRFGGASQYDEETRHANISVAETLRLGTLFYGIRYSRQINKIFFIQEVNVRGVVYNNVHNKNASRFKEGD